MKKFNIILLLLFFLGIIIFLLVNQFISKPSITGQVPKEIPRGKDDNAYPLIENKSNSFGEDAASDPPNELPIVEINLIETKNQSIILQENSESNRKSKNSNSKPNENNPNLGQNNSNSNANNSNSEADKPKKQNIINSAVVSNRFKISSLSFIIICFLSFTKRL